MADEDGGDWFADAGDDLPPPPVLKRESLTAEPPPQEPTDAATGEGAQAGEKREEAADEYLDPDKQLVFKHWIRPRFLQYKYLYDYRRNYYDDVIDFLDKRQRGLRRETPRPQTWGERVLRTYTNKLNRSQSFRQTLEDTKLVTQTKLSGAFQAYHNKEYFNRRHSSLLY